MTLETANRLYELRKKHNLSQEELAEKLGVSRQAVSKWERSEASPDTDNLIALAKIYNLSLDELIYGEKEGKKEEPKAEPEQEPETEIEDEEEYEEEYEDDLYIDIDDGGDKVKIGSNGILVEEKNGNTVKINVNCKIMEKIMDHIEINENSSNENDGGTKVLINESGHIRINKPVKKTRFWLEFPYTIICVIAYLLFGFYNVLGGWALSWVIFITIPIYYSLVESIYKKRFSDFAYPIFTAFVYLVCGMYFENWHPSWIIFVTIPVYYPIASALDKKIQEK